MPVVVAVAVAPSKIIATSRQVEVSFMWRAANPRTAAERFVVGAGPLPQSESRLVKRNLYKQPTQIYDDRKASKTNANANPSTKPHVSILVVYNRAHNVNWDCCFLCFSFAWPCEAKFFPVVIIPQNFRYQNNKAQVPDTVHGLGSNV